MRDRSCLIYNYSPLNLEKRPTAKKCCPIWKLWQQNINYNSKNMPSYIRLTKAKLDWLIGKTIPHTRQLMFNVLWCTWYSKKFGGFWVIIPMSFFGHMESGIIVLDITSDGVAIKIPYEVDVLFSLAPHFFLFHWLKLNSIFLLDQLGLA